MCTVSSELTTASSIWYWRTTPLRNIMDVPACNDLVDLSCEQLKNFLLLFLNSDLEGRVLARRPSDRRMDGRL